MNETIKCIADIERIEKIALADRNLASTTYQAIKESARAHPNAIAIRYIENGEKWKAALENSETSLSADFTYAELLNNINRTANLLWSLGVGDSDVVSMLLPNIPEAHFVLWGAEACGIVNPINYLLESEEIGAIAQSANTKVMVIMGEHAEVDIASKLQVIRQHAPCLEHVLVVGEIPKEASDCLSFDILLEAQRGSQLDFERELSPNSVASLFHTGGTTGLPKLAQHTHLNEVYTAWALNSMLGAKANDCLLTGLPLFHCNAAIATGLLSFMQGACVLLAGINGYRTTGIVQNMFGIIEHYGVSNFSAVPTIYAVLAQLPANNYDLSSLKMAGCGAAPMPVELFKKFEKVTGVRVLEGYGLTEATVVSTMSPPEADRPRIGSIGLRLPYTEIKIAIVDGEGKFVRECNVDEVGGLLIRGPSVTPGYTDNTKNAALFCDDEQGKTWLNSGDLARQDSDGYFWLTGRAKELIIRGGHNIDPKIIEEALAKHPAVNLAAAIGRPDTYAGEIPVAYVDTVADTSESELLEFCQQKIGERAAIPKSIVILDKLPVTGVGKIHKPTLHLMELKRVVEHELEALSSMVAQYHVHTELDKKLGNKATITITRLMDTDKLELEKLIQQRLGSYSFAYDVEIV